MSYKEFSALYAQCIGAKDRYFTEAEKTASMLASCTPGPLSFKKRFAVLCQEIVEKNAHLMYLGSKRLLHSAALRGYESLPNESAITALKQ